MDKITDRLIEMVSVGAWDAPVFVSAIVVIIMVFVDMIGQIKMKGFFDKKDI